MAKHVKSPKGRNNKFFKSALFLIPAIAFVIKLLIIFRIEGFDWYGSSGGDIASGLKNLLDNNNAPAHVWYGADAENYLRSVMGLFRDGFFSKESNLHYWPSGYPILIWVLGLLSKSSMLALIAVLQSALYMFACYFFANEIRNTRLVNFAVPLSLFLTLNPTLALNTISIGYEMPTAAFSLIAISALIKTLRLNKPGLFSAEFFAASISMAFAAFMQPRLALLAFAFFLIWGIAKFPAKAAAITLVISMFVVLTGPAVMIFRNQQAMGFTAISTNLGTTMNIGAGDNASGGYGGEDYGVDCPEAVGNPAEADSARVRCVISWYLTHPVQALKLSWNKTLYFWSPWFGPEANGTMARNPWRVNHPLNETIKTQDGVNTVFGTAGKLTSWIWTFGGLLFLALGFRFLWQARGMERVWGTAAFALVLLNWLSSIATIGDHRFRVPTMTLSLALQVFGLYSILLNKRKRLIGSAAVVTWPGLHWKAKPENDNLQP